MTIDLYILVFPSLAIKDIENHVTDNPVVLAIFNSNDGSHAPVQPSPQLPQLEANKSVKLLVPKLQDRGYCVIPVINQSKAYLEALLDALGREYLPNSVKFVMFISSTHGRCDEICMNGEMCSIPEIMQRLSKVPCESFLALFDGCQSNDKSFHVEFVEKSYMAVYTSPPELPTLHVDGVGVCIICLSNILSEDVSTPRDLVDRLGPVYEQEIAKYDSNPNLRPVSVHNYSPGTINLQDLTESACKQSLNIILLFVVY